MSVLIWNIFIPQKLYIFIFIYMYIILSKKETQHVKKYNLLQNCNIILNTEISIT